MIARSIERDLRGEEPAKCVRELRAVRVKNREVEQASAIRRRRRTTEAFPGVEPDMMVITAGRNKRGLRSEALRQLETEDAAVKPERALEVSNFEMNVADARAGIDGRCQVSSLLS